MPTKVLLCNRFRIIVLFIENKSLLKKEGPSEAEEGCQVNHFAGEARLLIASSPVFGERSVKVDAKGVEVAGGSGETRRTVAA
jgi:hypothetical protein